MKSVDYTEYAAKPFGGENVSGRSPTFRRAAAKAVIDTFLLPYALLRHRQLRRQGQRVDDHTYTCFLRAPAQLSLISGPVLDYLGRGERLEITLLACSNGAEPYTIASWLAQAVPGLDFHIRASDLHPEMVARAQAARYSRDEVLHSEYMTQSFLDATFEEDADGYVVRPEIRARVSFSQASLLDGDGLRAEFGQAPLVVAQNVLFHLPPDLAADALRNLYSLTKPGGALLIEGMDLDLRAEVTEQLGLVPFTEDLRRVYEETRVHTPLRWWRYYWGTEPFMHLRPNRSRRYATAFKRPAG
ncbi:CheR family methyltransferase [Aliiruegeria lutimaris]|nr:CheR family methyltransferase [Aliiruegeria lutimaris]